MHTWFVGVRCVELCASLPGSGAERVLTLITGASHRERIGDWVEERRFTIEVLDPPRFARSWCGRIELAPRQDGTRIDWRIDWTVVGGRLGALLDRALVVPVLQFALSLSLVRLRHQLARTGAR
jgi:hypothetical protein